MSEKNNATCSICGKDYHVCLSCKDAIQLSPWKIHCCSVDCYKVYQVVRGFSTGVYTKDEFKSKLKNIDLSNLENYREHIKTLIKDALKEEIIIESNKAEIAIKDNVIVEDIKAEDIETDKDVETVEDVEKTENIMKTVYSRKRNYKVNNEVEETE